MRWTPAEYNFACMLAGWHVHGCHADSLRTTHSSRGFRPSRCHTPAQVGKRADCLAQRRVLQRALLAELHEDEREGWAGQQGCQHRNKRGLAILLKKERPERQDALDPCAGSALALTLCPQASPTGLNSSSRPAAEARGGEGTASLFEWSGAQCRPLGHIASMQATCAWEADRHGMLAGCQPAYFTHRWGS